MMTDKELIAMVEMYMNQYRCDAQDAISDLEFDGPDGSHGPSESDVEMLSSHFDLNRSASA